MYSIYRHIDIERNFEKGDVWSESVRTTWDCRRVGCFQAHCTPRLSEVPSQDCAAASDRLLTSRSWGSFKRHECVGESMVLGVLPHSVRPRDV